MANSEGQGWHCIMLIFLTPDFEKKSSLLTLCNAQHPVNVDYIRLISCMYTIMGATNL